MKEREWINIAKRISYVPIVAFMNLEKERGGERGEGNIFDDITSWLLYSR